MLKANGNNSIAFLLLGIWTVLGGAAGGECTTVQDYETIANYAPLHVAADGSQPFTTIQSALDSIPWIETRWVVVFIHNGNYREKIRIAKSRVILKGEDREKTRIEYPQLRADFEKNPDKLGLGVVNIQANEIVLDNLTVENTGGVLGPHQFAVYGTGSRIVFTNANFLSMGGDTVSLWESLYGCYYHANCFFKGAVDFVCPRGWCYITNSKFYEVQKTAALWHDGRAWKSYKFVVVDSSLDGVEGWKLGRYHNDAQLYLLRCKFSATMADAPIAPTQDDPSLLKWGKRVYYFDCHREGGDFDWFKDNLATAEGAPTPEQITPKWTFDGRWDPLPIVRAVENIRFPNGK